MGYELHITRAEESYDSEEAPILLDEWLRYAEDSPLLALAGWIEWSDLGRVSVFAYACADEEKASLAWDGAQILVKGVRDEVSVLDLLKAAAHLQANLIGDDGERYTAEGIARRR